MKLLATLAIGAVTFATLASAQTNLLAGGDIRLAAGWDNGLPNAGKPATIAVDGILGDSDTFGFGTGATVNHTAGTINAVPGSGTGFNMNGGGVWNMSGGKISARYVLANGTNATFNFSGGTVELADVAGTQHFGTANDGKLNISGSVVVDGTQATTVVQTGGPINFSTRWSGSWTWGIYSGDDWKNLFIAGSNVKVNGELIDGPTFDSLFTVTNGGKTLAFTDPTQETEFAGGDMFAPGDWSKGLPVSPTRFGISSADGIHNNAHASPADWQLTVKGGTITAAQDWSFSGGSRIVIEGGTLDVAGDIRAEDTSILTFTGGAVSWAGKLDTGTSYDNEIVISGGAFDGTASGTTTFGNKTGSGILTIAGGAISSSVFDFSSPSGLATLGGGAVLDGTSATFGILNIRNNWAGSFTITSFSGSDWEDEFLAGNITFEGAVLDAADFALRFTASNGGQTLAYTPNTGFIGGDIMDPLNWTNGLPTGLTVGTIATDGTLAAFASFGAGAVTNMTGGILTVAEATGFNTYGGGTWNISGGTILARYFLANSQNGSSVVNLSGGLIELADVTGNQQMGVGNGGALNISGPAVLDGTHATDVVQTNGTIDIKSEWTGSWTMGNYSGYAWELLFVDGKITLDGSTLDPAGFAVTNGGRTLSRGAGGTPDPGPPVLVAQGFNEFGEFAISARNLNPYRNYQLRRGADLLSFPDTVDVPTDGGTTFQFFDTDPPAGKAFYQIQELQVPQ